MFVARLQSRIASISDAVYIEIIAALHGTMVPILVAGVCQAVVGTISVTQTGDRFTALLTALGVIVAIVRMLGLLAFRRQTSRKPLRS